MQHEAEYEKLVRLGDYYDELLRMGHVAARIEDTKAWRDEIKTKARADKVRVRTGLSDHDPNVAWAYLQHLDKKELTDEDGRHMADQLDAVHEAFGRAGLRGHKITHVIRAEGSRAAAACPDCGARLYIDWSEMPPFMDGEVFEVDCPDVRASEL